VVIVVELQPVHLENGMKLIEDVDGYWIPMPVVNSKKSSRVRKESGNGVQHLEPVAVVPLAIPNEIESLAPILFVIAISLLDEMYSPDARYLAMRRAMDRVYKLGLSIEDFNKFVQSFDEYKRLNRSPIESMF
jgi:hypothetical protein